MSDIVICRICLRADAKSYHYEQFKLKYYYEQITACKVNERELLPRWFCFECATLLVKYHKFRQKCLTGQNTLREITWNGMLSYEAISKIDRDERNLQSPLSITHTDEGNTVSNVLSPTVPYKKRTNIKNDHIGNEVKLTNTYDSINHEAKMSMYVVNHEAKIVNTYEVNHETKIPNTYEVHHETKLTNTYQVNHETKMANTYEQLTAVRPTIQHENIIEIRLPENMEISKPNNIKTEEIMNSATNIPLEPLIGNTTESSNFTTYIDPSYQSNDSVYASGQDTDQWLQDINESPTTDNEQKQWTKQQQSYFLDPANWKRTMLTEDEAVMKFHKRAFEPKYVNARYKCMDCFSNFARDEMLRKHILINHVESLGPHVCRLCKRRFHKACKLRLHMKRHYVQIQCLRCDMVFWGEGLAFQHEQFHRGVTTTCQYCNHQFRHKSTYYQHLRTHHRSAHVCALCGASFVSKAGLNVHKRRLHSLDDKLGQRETLKEPDANIYCKRCDMKFASLAAYQEHYRHSTLHADACDAPSDGTRDQDAGWQSVRCTVCNVQCLSYSALVKHHRVLHPGVPFMRKAACGAKSNERVSCDLCGARIKVTSLYTHMNAHTRTKVYTCEICNMQFNYPTSLLRHKVTHTGEKKHPCPLCEKRFTQRNSMQLHYRTFHLKEPYPKRNRQKKKPPATEPDQLLL